MQPGTMIAGKYRVEGLLGEGGMGVVVAAIHLQLEQRVAIKMMLPEAMQQRDAVERFLREARAAVRLRSEHVGRVIDVGTLENGAPFMVMEYLDGTDLGRLVRSQGPVPMAVGVEYILQACTAIAEAHVLGIIHRDLKPANLFLTCRSDGSPLIKVLDFGISKAAQRSDSGNFGLTKTATVMGSPGYMSPEQLRSSRDVDARSDVWALGVTLYEITSGRVPFAADSFSELCLKVAMDPTPQLYVYGAPLEFAQVVYRCLEKDPARRYQNVAELALALAPFAGTEQAQRAAQAIARTLRVSGVADGVIRPADVRTAAPTTVDRAAGALGTMPPRRNKRAAAIVGAVLVIGAGIGVAVALGSREEKKEDVKEEVAAKPEPPKAPEPEKPQPQPPQPPKTDVVASQPAIAKPLPPPDAAPPPPPDAAPAKSVPKKPDRPDRKKPASSPSSSASGEDLYDTRN